LEPHVDQRLAAWMKQAQDGDREAYERLLIEVTALVRRFVGARLGHAGWTDDVVQETLFSIHRDRHTYDPSRSFGSWMYAIARHRLIDWTRKRRRVLAHEELREEAPERASSSDPLLEHGALERVRRAWLGLSSQQREVIQQLELDGLSVREVAQATRLSESSVKVSAHRGYKALRKLLSIGTDED
jgi:RNA polymerase sigma-70 factor (ECF subfamily)